MKRKKAIASLFLICNLNALEDVTHKEYSIPTETTHLYVTIDNRHNIENFQDHHGKMTASSESSSTSGAYATVHNHLSAFFSIAQKQCNAQTMHMIKEQAEKKFLSARDVAVAYVKEQKYNIPLVLGATTYGYLFFALMNHSYNLMRHDTWSCWKESIPFEMLKIIPEQELGKELVLAAQEKYQKPDTLIDLLTPLIFFLKDIDYELHRLNKFLWLYTWLQKLHASCLFPLHDKLVDSATIKYNRLLYLKKVFIRWVTDYKLALDKKNNEAS